MSARPVRFQFADELRQPRRRDNDKAPLLLHACRCTQEGEPCRVCLSWHRAMLRLEHRTAGGQP